MIAILRFVSFSVLLAACGSVSTTTSTILEPATTTSTPSTPTTSLMTTTLPPPTLPAPTTTTLPTTADDFASIYRELDALRSEATFAPDLASALSAVTEWSSSYDTISGLVADGNYIRRRAPGEYTIDGVELYDRPSEDLVLLLVTDTVTSPSVMFDGNDAEVSTYDREPDTQVFLVALIQTEEGWRIGADIPVTNPETGSTEIVNRKPSGDALDLAVDTPGLSVKVWTDGAFLCSQQRLSEPAIGPMVRCEAWNGPVDQFTSYGLPLVETDGTVHTLYRLDSPGGQIREIRIDTDQGETVTFTTVSAERGEYRVGFTGFVGSPSHLSLYSETGELVFESDF